MIYTEHEKLKLVSEKSHAIGEFVEEFLRGKGIYLCEDSGDEEDHWRMCRIPITKLLAEFFKLDLNKLEEEKQHLISQMKLQNK